MSQPIIRGIQSVGAVDITYQYNSPDGKLAIPSTFNMGSLDSIDTGAGVAVAGFRLDSTFLAAAQQIASSVTIPILGGGGVTLTNNNRTGTLSLACTKVSSPDAENAGSMASGVGFGPVGGAKVYDMVLLAQLQQAQEGGDAYGATLTVSFKFSGKVTKVTFDGCTVASVEPLALAGNDAVTYGVNFNYLNWSVDFSSSVESGATGSNS